MNPRSPEVGCASLDIVIVGNGAAAAEAVLAVRGSGYSGDVDLFADNSYPPYNPMLGTYYAAGEIPMEQCFPYGGAEFYERRGIRAHLGVPIAALDPREKTLTTGDGRCFTYRSCLVASGATTTFPPVPGLDAPGVFGLRSFDDAVALRGGVAAAVARAGADGRPARGMVVGASFAGIKVAGVLAQAGLEVSIVEREQSVLPLVVHPDFGHALELHLRERGHVLRLGTTLESVAATADGLRVAFRAAGGGGDEMGVGEEDVDLVIVCTGTRPNLGFLDPGEVVIEAGLLVDEHMRTSVPDLFAAGDVAQAFDPVSGAHEVVALWSNARRQGRVAGLGMAGVHAEYPGNVPCNVQHIGDLLFACGGSMRECDAVDVSGDARGLTALAFRDGRLAGFNLLGDVRVAGPLVKALGCRVDSGETGTDTVEALMRRITWTNTNVG